MEPRSHRRSEAPRGEPRRSSRPPAAEDHVAALGTIAAGVAHEINNPLAWVAANIEFALERLRARWAAALDEGDEAAAEIAELVEALQEAHGGTRRIATIVRDLRAVSRAHDDTRTPVDVRRALSTSVSIAFPSIRHRARLVEDYGPCPTVLANDARLGQIFLNLLVNAAEAIPEEDDPEAHLIRVSTATDGRGHAVVAISDDGVGIAEEIRSRLFEPFFTTKAPGRGTGLGLPITRRLVEGLGGEIEVESSVGVGTTFRISLPPSKEETAPGPVRRSSLPAARGPRRILVVDDEPQVGSALRRLLSSFGPRLSKSKVHEVDVETSGERALARFEQGERWDVVLCDLLMPRPDGQGIHAAIAAVDPAQAARIVFMTGGVPRGRHRAFLDSVPNVCLAKPFDREALRAIVEDLEILDGAR
jgi:nitrogen-specific signal transduction histidine kinase